MDRTSIDLRSISCAGVKSFSLFQKPSLSAAVSIAGQKKRTAADPDGGGDPEWAESFRFDLDPDLSLPDLSLRIDVVAQGSLLLLLPDRVVGRVNVPVADLLREGGDGSVRHVSYRVEGADGRPNGVARFSFNVNREAAALPVGAGGYRPPPPRQLGPAASSPAGDFSRPPPRQLDPVMAFPAAGRYPPPRQQTPATSSAATEYYPPPRQHDPVVSSRAVDFYPPPAAEEHYPAARRLYPAPRQQEPVTCYPPRAAGVLGYYLPAAPAERVAYPAPWAPPEEPASCYPPPQAAYCYPAPDAYPPESWDRRLY